MKSQNLALSFRSPTKIDTPLFPTLMLQVATPHASVCWLSQRMTCARLITWLLWFLIQKGRDHGHLQRPAPFVPEGNEFIESPWVHDRARGDKQCAGKSPGHTETSISTRGTESHHSPHVSYCHRGHQCPAYRCSRARRRWAANVPLRTGFSHVDVRITNRMDCIRIEQHCWNTAKTAMRTQTKVVILVEMPRNMA